VKASAFLVLSTLLVATHAARAELDLTPTAQMQQMEMQKIARVVFHDGATEITYQPPNGWTCSGSHTSVTLTIPDHPQARATIQYAPRLRIPAFDDKVMKVIQANPSVLQLPKGAKDIKITEIDIDPLIVDSHHTLDIQLTYSFFGQACAKSILLVDRKGAEVSFTLDTLAPDYQMLQAAFRRSVFTIENL
jgi:hypothetical protein